MIQEATCLVELFEENIVPGAPLLGYLFRLGTPGMAYVWPLPFPCWLGLFSVDFFSLELIGFPLSRSRPLLHLLRLLNIEIGSFWVGAQGDLAWEP